ncbi:MAG: hypothetical protein ACTS7I_01670 [Candidatus Hodgkinia cicadicola]
MQPKRRALTKVKSCRSSKFETSTDLRFVETTDGTRSSERNSPLNFGATWEGRKPRTFPKLEVRSAQKSDGKSR